MYSIRLVVLCLLALFITISVQAQDEPKIIPSLDDAKTVQDVLDWFKQETQTAGNNYQRRETPFVQAGKKMIEFAEAGADVNTIIAGLKSIVATRRAAGIHGSDDYDRLSLFLNELEKAGTYPDLVKSERYWVFTERERFIPDGMPRENTLADFERIMKGAKQWVNSPPPNVKSSQPIQFMLDLADSHSVRRADPDCLPRTIERLIEFAQSDEMTADSESKKEVVDFLKKNQRRQVGSDPKLYGKTLDDKDFDWEKLRGKYVLIKFTATWCGPCKAEIPGMLEAYGKYRNKGFEIVSVYIAERTSDPVAAVKKAVEGEKLPWIILSEALTERAKQPKQGDFYAIRFVPTMLLVDKEGKIIMREARGKDLQAKLAEIFE